MITLFFSSLFLRLSPSSSVFSLSKQMPVMDGFEAVSQLRKLEVQGDKNTEDEHEHSRLLVIGERYSILLDFTRFYFSKIISKIP